MFHSINVVSMELFFMCLKIFFARIIDVSIATIRQNVLYKDYICLGTLLAFLEVFIWFTVVKEALVVAVDSVLIPISYSLGYATGTFIGTFFSRRWFGGVLSVQVITKVNNHKLLCALKLRGFSISTLSLDNDNYQMIFIEVKNKSYLKLKRIIHDIDAEAFIIVSDTKKVWNGIIK